MDRNTLEDKHASGNRHLSGYNQTPVDKPISGLFSFLDLFAAPAKGGDSVRLAEGRVLAGANLVLALTMFTCLLITLLTPQHPAYLYTMGMFASGLAINIGSLLLQRHFTRLTLLRQLTLLSSFLCILAYAYVRRGPLGMPPDNQPLIFQLALALFVLGSRNALVWVMIVLFTQIGLQLSYAGMPTEGSATFVMLDNMIPFYAVIGLILLIEMNRDKLQQQHSSERERYRYLATHDALTSLANRSLFETRLNEAIKQGEKDESRVVLLYIDLDDFKPINDRWGHDVGDRVLKIVAARLISATRATDTVARLGGDEFAVLMPSLERNTSVTRLSDSIHDRLTQPIHLHGRHLSIGCSIGICSYPENAVSPEQLWQQADAAMYVAKKNESRWHIHTEDVDTAL